MDADAAVTPDGFDLLQRETLEQRIQVFPARSWWPSSLGHPCDRQVVWRFTRWESATKHDATLESIFEQGRTHQPVIYTRLEAMGFEVVRESDRPRQYKVAGTTISGRIDGKLMAWRREKYHPPRVLEIKTLSSFVWDRISTANDVRQASSHWTRSYYAQMQAYLFLEETPFGAFVFENKATGMLKCVPVELDYAFAESLLKRVERLQPLVARSIDPDPIPYDGNVCGSCGFCAQCYPPRNFGEGATVLEDPTLIEQLEQRERLKAARDEYDDVDKAVKARLKHEGIKSAIAGSFIIEASERPVAESTRPARTDIVYTIRRQGG